jgi:hypothetical protein
LFLTPSLIPLFSQVHPPSFPLPCLHCYLYTHINHVTIFSHLHTYKHIIQKTRKGLSIISRAHQRYIQHIMYIVTYTYI